MRRKFVRSIRSRSLSEPYSGAFRSPAAEQDRAIVGHRSGGKDDFQNIATQYANGIRWYAAEGLEQ